MGGFMKIVALAGGVGASKLLFGLARVMDSRRLTIIVNTGDDLAMHGLDISPDLDIVTYTLAGVVNEKTGWGFAGDTFQFRDRLAFFSGPQWFNLGDRDLATHIFRTEQLHNGATLSKIAERIRVALGVKAKILPMSDTPVRTLIDTPQGTLKFQEYLVKLQAKAIVRGLRFEGSAKSRPAPGVLKAIAEADGVVFCPSNPLISIGPILAVPGIREALTKRRAHVLAVCPIVGGKSLKGPSDRMMKQMGHDVSAVGVARIYGEICGNMMIDRADAGQAKRIEELGMRAIVAPTVMSTAGDNTRLARVVLASFAGRNRFNR
jgi:LPPG:FO 2-phospho-L-lactate transferase